jgi:hypothetical protein
MSEDKKVEAPTPEKTEEKPVEPEKKRKTSIFRDPYVKVE